MKLDRNALIGIREQANSQSKDCGSDWKQAYLSLAKAADHLDAMMARTEVRPNIERTPKRELENCAQCQLATFIKSDDELKDKAGYEWKQRYGYEYPQYTKDEFYEA